jgi:hypothetical protein
MQFYDPVLEGEVEAYADGSHATYIRTSTKGVYTTTENRFRMFFTPVTFLRFECYVYHYRKQIEYENEATRLMEKILDETEQFYMRTDEYKIEMLVAFRTGANTDLEYSHFGDDSKDVGLSGGDFEPGTTNRDRKKCYYSRCVHEITKKVHRCINAKK